MVSVAMEKADELNKMKPQNLNDTSACAPPDEKWHYAIFLCICCLWLCVGMNNASVAWTLKDIADSQLLDLRQEGVLASGFAMGYCLGPVTMGILLDSWHVLAQTPDIPIPLLKLGFSTTTRNFNQTSWTYSDFV